MRKNQKGFSLIELLIVVAIILIIMAIAVPNLIKQKIGVQEAAAIANLRAINNAALTYSTQCGGYPPSLAALGGPFVPCKAADLLDSVLAGGAKSGYVFTYRAGQTDTNGNVLSYAITAVPITIGTTGQKQFFSDSSGTIRVNLNGPADVNSTPIS